MRAIAVIALALLVAFPALGGGSPPVAAAPRQSVQWGVAPTELSLLEAAVEWARADALPSDPTGPIGAPLDEQQRNALAIRGDGEVLTLDAPNTTAWLVLRLNVTPPSGGWGALQLRLWCGGGGSDDQQLTAVVWVDSLARFETLAERTVAPADLAVLSNWVGTEGVAEVDESLVQGRTLVAAVGSQGSLRCDGAQLIRWPPQTTLRIDEAMVVADSTVELFSDLTVAPGVQLQLLRSTLTVRSLLPARVRFETGSSLVSEGTVLQDDRTDTDDGSRDDRAFALLAGAQTTLRLVDMRVEDAGIAKGAADEQGISFAGTSLTIDNLSLVHQSVGLHLSGTGITIAALSTEQVDMPLWVGCGCTVDLSQMAIPAPVTLVGDSTLRQLATVLLRTVDSTGEGVEGGDYRVRTTADDQTFYATPFYGGTASRSAVDGAHASIPQVTAVPLRLRSATETVELQPQALLHFRSFDLQQSLDPDLPLQQVTFALPIDVWLDHQAPRASAGPDVTIDQGTLVTLSAANSTDDDPSFPAGGSFIWTIPTAAGTVLLQGMTVEHAFDELGRFDVGLTVSDPAGHIDQKVVRIKVRDSTAPVIAPLAPLRIGEGVVPSVTAQVHDNDPHFAQSGIVTWNWSEGSVWHETLGSTFTRSFGQVGSLVVTVRAEDAAGNVATALWQVEVLDVHNPIVALGEPRTLAVGERLVLNGTAFASDNDPGFPTDATFLWEVRDPLGQVRTLEGPLLEVPLLHQGAYTLTLTVHDGAGNEGAGSLQVRASEPLGPGPQPIAPEGTLRWAGFLVGLVAVGLVILVVLRRGGASSPPVAAVRPTSGRIRLYLHEGGPLPADDEE